MTELIYKELSYKLNGLAFGIFKKLGSGLRESVYSDAFELCHKRENISYVREYHKVIEFEGKRIATNFFDYIIDNRIVVELKRGDKDYYQAFEQLKNYLQLSRLK